MMRWTDETTDPDRHTHTQGWTDGERKKERKTDERIWLLG